MEFIVSTALQLLIHQISGRSFCTLGSDWLSCPRADVLLQWQQWCHRGGALLLEEEKLQVEDVVWLCHVWFPSPVSPLSALREAYESWMENSTCFTIPSPILGGSGVGSDPESTSTEENLNCSEVGPRLPSTLWEAWLQTLRTKWPAEGQAQAPSVLYY